MRKIGTVLLALVSAAFVCAPGLGSLVHAAPREAQGNAPGYSKQIGSFFVEVLPQYQLMEAAFSQSLWAEPLDLPSNNNDYMADLNTFMEPYRDHRAVRLMNEISGWFGASAFVTYAFHLGPLPDLELLHEFPDELYELAGGKQRMEEFRLAMKALAEESEFLDFVRRWQPHYETWAEQAVRGTNLERVEKWLTGFSGT